MGSFLWVRIGNALMAIVLMTVILFAYIAQITTHQEPCPLCLLQRIGMIGIAMGNLMNLKFGFKIPHYAFSLLWVLFGGTVSLRQIMLHVCPDFPVYEKPFWGFYLYSWSFLVYACSFFALILMLFLYTNKDGQRVDALNWLDKIAFVFTLFVIICNIVTALRLCNFGLC